MGTHFKQRTPYLVIMLWCMLLCDKQVLYLELKGEVEGRGLMLRFGTFNNKPFVVIKRMLVLNRRNHKSMKLHPLPWIQDSTGMHHYLTWGLIPKLCPSPENVLLCYCAMPDFGRFGDDPLVEMSRGLGLMDREG